MTFDPSVYEKPDHDMQQEPNLSDGEWVERFVAAIIKDGTPRATDDFRRELPEYAQEVASSYLKDRREYVSPEEAAETDIGYWEDDE